MSKQWYTGWIIFCKEIIDNARDKRSIVTILISVIATPILYIGFITFIEKTATEKTDLLHGEAIELPVIGSEYAPNLMQWLTKYHINIIPIAADADYQKGLTDGEHIMVLRIEPEYALATKKAKTAPLSLIHDSTVSGLKKIGFTVTQRAIQAYAQQVGSLRLVNRGIDPSIAQPIRINTSDIAPTNLQGIQILSMLPYLLTIFIMTGGMYLAIDTTAGEREKGTLESLIIQPANRSTILLAKLFATTFFSFLTVSLALFTLALAFAYSPSQTTQFSLSVIQIITLMIVCLPLCLVLSTAMILLASFTKSFKEAQSYMGYAMMLPMAPLLWIMLSSPEPSLENMWVPIASQALIIIEVIKSDAVALPLLAISFIITGIVAVILALLAIKLYQKERILG